MRVQSILTNQQIQSMMRRIASVSTISFIIILVPILAHSQDSSMVSYPEFREELTQLRKEFQTQKELYQSLLDRSEQNLEMASKIIDWSAMFFAALTLILIIAGAVGLKEFSNIRKIEAEMISINKGMKDEIERIQEIKSTVQKELNDIKRSIEKDSKDFLRMIYLLNEGITNYRAGNLSDAIEAFSKMKKINPNDYEATCFLARCYAGQEKYDLAINTAKPALNLVEKPSLAYYIIGEAYRRMKRFDLSIDSFKKSLDMDRNIATLNSLGYSYFKSGDYDNAIEAFRESLDMERESTACCGLAKSHLKKGFSPEANKYFVETIILAEEEIARGSVYVWPYHSLAFSHFALDHQGDCIETLKIALAKNITPSIIKEQLYDYKIMKDENDISQDLLNKCLDLFDNFLRDLKAL